MLLTDMFNLSRQTVITKTSVKMNFEKLLQDVTFYHQKSQRL